MGDRIIELLSSKKNNNLTLEQISRQLGEDILAVKAVLSYLETEGTIFLQENGKYILTKNTRLKKGVIKLTVSKGPIVVFEDKSELKLSNKMSKILQSEDTVLVEPYNKSGTAMVIKILNHEVKNYVGEIVKEGIQYKIVAYNKPDIILEEPYPVGMRVLVDGNTKNIINVLGHKDDPNTRTKEVLVKKKFPISFSAEYLEELKQIPLRITSEEISKMTKENTIDLRNLNFITIDGEDTKDFDDAVGYNNSTIYISIANTTKYIKEGTKIWDETLKRDISVYTPGCVEPMLHHKISNGICSLIPLEDRCSLTTAVKIDDDGEIISYDIFPSIIKSRKKLTYENSNEYLENNNIVEGYENYTESLNVLYQKAMLVKEKMLKKGFLSFSDMEVKFLLTGFKVINVQKKYQGKAGELIEFLMILNNMVMIDYFQKNNLPFISRNHGEPDYKNLKNWSLLLKKRNYEPIVSDHLTSKEIMYNRSLYENSPEKEVLDKILIRCQSTAKYGTCCYGHYALGNIAYARFTSPIRRISDFINQRIYFDALKYGNEYAKKKWTPILPNLVELANSAEKRAEKVELMLDDIKKAEYMADFIGCEYMGIVSEVSTSYIKVVLPNMCEGKILLQNGRYKTSKDKFVLHNVNNGNQIIIGDQINVKLRKVDTVDGKLEFLKVEENKKYEKAGNKTKKKVKGR